jgi:hypothetical protein
MGVFGLASGNGKGPTFWGWARGIALELKEVELKKAAESGSDPAAAIVVLVWQEAEHG